MQNNKATFDLLDFAGTNKSLVVRSSEATKAMNYLPIGGAVVVILALLAYFFMMKKPTK